MERKIVQFPRIAEITGLSVPTLRWMRHNGTGPRTFRLGRRVVAYEDDVVTWIDEQAQREHPRGAA